MSNDVFVGLDWATQAHAVCVIDAAGTVLDRFDVSHDREGLAELMRRLSRWGARVRIAIERPSGLIVDALVEAGHQVFPIHPNAVKARARGIYQAARARGCDHTHAIRILARAWLRVIWRAWTDRKPYDAALHRAATQHVAAHGG